MEFFNKNGFKSSWIREGSGKKILFLPGWAESHSVWKEICPSDLAYEKIFLNLGGHHPSEFPSGKPQLTLDEFLNSHFDVINHLADNDKLILVGHSTGGFIAMMYTNQFPDKVDKIVLVGSYIEGPIGGLVNLIKLFGEWNFFALPDFIFRLFQNSKSIFYDVALSVNPIKREEFLNRDYVKEFFPSFFEEYKKMNPKSLRIVIEILDSIRLSNLQLKENLPLHFIHGDKDPTVPYSQIKNFCDNYKSANLITIPDTGHSPHWENPTLFWKYFKKITMRRRRSRILGAKGGMNTESSDKRYDRFFGFVTTDEHR